MKKRTKQSVKRYRIEFEPVGRRGQCQADQALLACARQLGVGIISLCGGQGICHSCKVQVLNGTSSEPSSNELELFSAQELKAGWRLACQTYPSSNCKLRVPAESITAPQRTQVEGLEIIVQPEPPVKAYQLQLPTPSLSDLRADTDSLLETLTQQDRLHYHKVDIDVLRTLSPQLRSWNWECQATVRNDEVIALGPWPSRQLGLAIDLGTTKVAGYLGDLGDGRTLAAKGIMNPQISDG